METRNKPVFPEPIQEVPDRIAIPVLPPYDKAMLENRNEASVRRLKNPEEIKELFARNEKREDIEDMLIPIDDNEECADIRMLDLLYTADLYDLWFRTYGREGAMTETAFSEDFIGHPVSMRFTRLMMAAEYNRSQTSLAHDKTVERLEKLKKLVGVIKKDKTYVFPVLTYAEITDKPAEIRFISPYMDTVIRDVLYASRDAIARAGSFAVPEGHMYHILSRNVKRNAPAYDVLRSAVNTVAQSETSPATIRLNTVLAESPDLRRALDRTTTTQSRRMTLQRAFIQGWKMLAEDTDLAETYEDIRLPNPESKMAIPTNTNVRNLAVNVTYTKKKVKETMTTGMTMIKGWKEIPTGKRIPEPEEKEKPVTKSPEEFASRKTENLIEIADEADEKTETGRTAKDAEKILEVKTSYVKNCLENEYGKRRIHTPCLTGYDGFDKSGGLKPGLHLIGTTTAAGENAFPFRLAEQIAENGRNVLYFSFEENHLKLLETAAKQYGSEKACAEKLDNRLCIIDGDGMREMTAAKIASIASYFTEEKTEPVVFVDYLQAIAQDTESTSDALRTLKIMQTNRGLIVVVSCRLNDRYETAPANLKPFEKENVNTFAPDVIRRTRLSAVGTKEYAESTDTEKQNIAETAMRLRPLPIDLVTLKDRSGKPADPIRFEYDPQTRLYTEVKGVTDRDVIMRIEDANDKMGLSCLFPQKRD